MKKYEVTDIPIEDLNLWKKAINMGLKFKILPEFLLYHRLHNNQITSNGRTNKTQHLKKGYIVVQASRKRTRVRCRSKIK